MQLQSLAHANSCRHCGLWNAFSWYSIFCLLFCIQGELQLRRNGDCDSGVICGHFAQRHFIYHLRWSGIGFALSPGIGIAGSLDLDERFRDEPKICPRSRGTHGARVIPTTFSPGDGNENKHLFVRFRIGLGFGFCFVFFFFCFVGRLLLALLMMQGAIMTHAYQTRSHNTQMLSASDSAPHSSSPSSWPPWYRLLSFLGAVALPQNARNGVKHD